MSNDLVPISFSEMNELANAVAKSNLFGVKTPQEALSLMAIAQAEGRHPASAAMDYHIIKGRPTLKAERMLSRFQASGGRVEWHEYTDERCDATLSHPQGGTVRVMWDMDRVKKAQISNPDMYRKYPRPMLRARVVSEGIRTVYPGVLSCMVTPEEADDIVEVKDIAPPKKVETLEAQFHEVKEQPQLGDDLKQQAKEFAEAVDICPTLNLLEFLVAEKKLVTAKLADELPAWHTKLIGKISDRRAYLAAPKETLGEILDAMPESGMPEQPDFLKRKHVEAAE